MKRTATCCSTTPIRMDTIQLTLFSEKDKFTQGVFEGVYPSDKLPASIPTLSAPHIANVHKSDKPGSSYIAFYFTKSKRENFFIVMDRLRAIIKNNNSCQWIFNTVTLQGVNSTVYGHYCLYYALFRSRQISMSTVVYRFSNNKRQNDIVVKRFMEKIFRLRFSKYRSTKKQTPCNFILTHFVECSK